MNALFSFDDLEVCRQGMRTEIAEDIDKGSLYISPRLTDQGRIRWPQLLLASAANGDALSLASELRKASLIRALEMRKTKVVKVPQNAPELLADGEFNRFYCRAVCLLALDQDLVVEVCRGKAVREPRPESAAKLGLILRPSALLSDLRSNPGLEPALGIPLPNSGLTVRLAVPPGRPRSA
jgi:hypothetical protein